jgi:hypothetical protein
MVLFRPFPSYGERSSWEKLDKNVKDYYLSEAQKLRAYNWPSLSASLYMDFQRNGNRSRYENLCFGRRVNLVKLLIAECITGSGEYLDDIINGVWLLCEESSWVVPAHNNHLRGNTSNKLPNIEDPVYIDLFSAETGSLLSWVYYFLGESIEKISPLVKRRIELEMTRRIFQPYLEHDDFHWMGLTHDEPVGNWNPWINSNMLSSYLIFQDVFPRAIEGVNKAIRSVNRFMVLYPGDGGWEEGPVYFRAGAASFCDCLQILEYVRDMSGIYDDGKIRNMISYIYKVYIGHDYYVNFADASPSVMAPVGLLERAASHLKDPCLDGFCLHLRETRSYNADIIPGHTGRLFRMISDIFGYGSGRPPTPLKLPLAAWFNSIQVLTARDNENGSGGLFFAAKGGHNDEGHNHNDIGNFILYRDGAPVIVDAGVGLYSKFTQNDDTRYAIWSMGSAHHNVPTINGEEQAPGRDHCATAVHYDDSGGIVRFSLDIADAYPKEAAIESWLRRFTFVRGKELVLEEQYRLKHCSLPPELNFLCHDKPEFGQGKVFLSGLVAMEFDVALFAWGVDEIRLEDEKMRYDWKKACLYRLRLTSKNGTAGGRFTLRFQPF